MSEHPRLTPARFFGEVVPQASFARKEHLTGLPEIARALRISVDTARRWHRNPDCAVPIRRIGGRYVARRSELEAWIASH